MSSGAQWRAEVKAAIAENHRQQRQRRGKPQTAPSGVITGPGMIRRPPPQAEGIDQAQVARLSADFMQIGNLAVSHKAAANHATEFESPQHDSCA
jgi:hypothetical protein